MSRPLNKDIPQGLQSWDAELRDDLKQFYKTPLPLPNGTFELASGSTEGTAYTDVGDLPAAGSYDGCIAVVNDGGNWIPYFSDGTTWWQLCRSDGTDINVLTDSTGGSPGGDTVSAVTNVATTNDAIATLIAKVNAIISALDLDI
jgi:hypothetical protein